MSSPTMTQALEDAFKQASALPADAQDQLAAQLLADIEGESKWDKTLAASQPTLEKLAAKARQAKLTGQVHKMGIDEL